MLRVQEPELADRIRQLLNAPDGAKQKDALMDLKFESECGLACALRAITCRSMAIGNHAAFGIHGSLTPRDHETLSVGCTCKQQQLSLNIKPWCMSLSFRPRLGAAKDRHLQHWPGVAPCGPAGPALRGGKLQDL